MLSALLIAASLVAPGAGVAAADPSPAVAPASVRAASPDGAPVDAAVAEGVPAGVAREVAARAAQRGVEPRTALAPIVNAARAGVPPEPVAAKVLEGLAKGVPPDRIVAVASALADRLVQAATLLDAAREAGLAVALPGRPAALSDLADALSAGVPPDAVLALIEAARAARGRPDAMIAAARTLGELARRGVPVVDALPLAQALATQPPRPAGEVGALFDAYRREGGESPEPFLEEATRRVTHGEPLDGIVDVYGETADHVSQSRTGRPPATPSGRGHGSGRGEPGAVPGLEGEPHGRAKGHSR